MADRDSASCDLDPHRRALYQGIVAAAPKTASSVDSAELDRFIQRYFEHLSLDDLSQEPAEDLAGAAISHYQLLQTHKDEALVHVSNPSFEINGWHSAHTVIEVVAEDQPWLVSSVRTALIRRGHRLHRVLHPVIETSTEPAKSLIHVEIDALPIAEHETVKSDIHQAFLMLDKARKVGDEMLAALKASAQSINHQEQREFISWLTDRQFACLGQLLLQVDDNSSLTVKQKLGLFDLDDPTACWQPEDVSAERFSQHNFSTEPLLIYKGSRLSPVIRNEHVDVILLPIQDSEGVLTGVLCTVGLFAFGLQNEAVSNIPWLRERFQRVIDASGASDTSHDGKAIASTLRSLPRDMLMQNSSKALLDMSLGIVSLQEQQHVKLFHSCDSLGRFCNCLVFIPRDEYSRDLRLDIEQILKTHADGICASFDMRFSSDSSLARLHFVIQRHQPLERRIEWSAIEQRIRRAAISWTDSLETTLRERHDEITAIHLARKYCSAFPVAYTEDYSPRAAAADIEFIEDRLTPDAPVMSFYRHIIADTGTVNFKLFAEGNSVSLSDVIPVIENMGLRVEAEHPFEIKREKDSTVWIHEFTVQHDNHDNSDESAETSAIRIQEAFDHIWRGDVENDGFNRLILDAGLDWRQVVILRALCKYLLQINVPFSQSYMIDSLVNNVAITRILVKLFETRFDPQIQDSADAELESTQLLDAFSSVIEQVASLDEDRILTSYRNLIINMLRTNAYRRDEHGHARNFLSFKFDSRAMNDLPLPRPMAEIFVYSADVEGIHLRGGKVARGGLRWSDRREDFRTEVLALMKAQMVKNAVIVPLGSKGGFYVKAELPSEREAMMDVVVGCYRTFLSGLLDVTDNIVGDAIIPPENVVRHDGDDPYLVVAADKGTATFSDFANEVSEAYGFWLGDAFASGGSAGYDHKKMGITARGAWESVKRHFRNLGIDTQSESFTVVGVGDMAGDVFGNGMLLSEHTKLIAAFNHQHIFIDPDPDAQSSFLERKRLFELPRSSWSDYNPELISRGGGIYNRHDKEIKLSIEAQKALGTSSAAMTPTALITIILKAPVDLFWNGGIGTYVKASSETHSDAADRANDVVRINGNELRCRVVGEGGNLGFTQRGRIEYARSGGLIYTDAIDNSAGVDCSDHEVNIKILLNAIVASDDLTLKQRDNLLESMTDEVASLVLADNYIQTQCIDLAFNDGSDAFDEQVRFMLHLESQNLLDRSIEFLPDADECAERMAAELGLFRPEIAVLVSYSKMVMYQELMKADLSAEPSAESILLDYFPEELQKKYSSEIANHRLKPEIINTIVTNEVVNRLGPTFVFRMQQELNVSVRDIAAAFLIVRSTFRMPELWASIESLDNDVSSDEQYRMQILVRGLVERVTHWLLRSRQPSTSIGELVSHFQSGVDELISSMPESLAAVQRETLEQRINHFKQAGAPDDIALSVARVVPLSSSLDIVEIAMSLSQSVKEIASVYFALGQHLELTWLRDEIGGLKVSSHWHTLATAELRSDLHYQQRHLCAEVASSTDQSLPGAERVALWATRNPQAMDKFSALVTELKANTSIDFAMLSLAVNEVHKLLRSDRPLAS